MLLLLTAPEKQSLDEHRSAKAVPTATKPCASNLNQLATATPSLAKVEAALFKFQNALLALLRALFA